MAKEYMPDDGTPSSRCGGKERSKSARIPADEERCTGIAKSAGGRRCRRLRGRCKTHAGRPVIHGKRSQVAGKPRTFADRIESLVSDPRVIELRQYAARLFALIQDVENTCKDEKLDASQIERFLELLNDGAQIAERYHRVAATHRMVDIAEARMLLGRFVEAVLPFVDGSRHPALMEALAREAGIHDDDTSALDTAPPSYH